MSDLWQRKLDAYLHDPPEKVLDLAWHKKRAESYEKGLGLEDVEFTRECDHTAAAADRLPWPRWQFLESSFDGVANHFKHPLGKATFRPEEAFQLDDHRSADLTHDLAKKQCPYLVDQDDPRAQFFAYWRCWRWWACDQPKGARLAFLPADTRIPDHTIWVHNSIVSALEACVGADGVCRPAFLLFQMGPVQEYIGQARRTLDLWSGSYLLSYLMATGLRHVALEYGPDTVIFPNLCGQPIFDLLLKEEVWDHARTSERKTLWDCFGYEGTQDGHPNDYGRRRLLTPSLPNRFLAILPAEKAAETAREVAERIREKHREIAAAVWEWAKGELGVANCWTDENSKRFDQQNDRFLDIAWQVVPWPDRPDQASRLAEVLPDATNVQHGPRSGLRTILEMARKLPPGENARTVPPGNDDHRDVRNFECETYPPGTRNAQGREIGGWKDRSKLSPDAKLDSPGAAWSALYQLANWQMDAIRHTRAWKAWSEGGWQVGKDCNKDSLNGKEEAILQVGPSENDAGELNGAANIPNLFKAGELLGATSLIKRLWPTAWLQDPTVHSADVQGVEVDPCEKPLFQRGDFSFPDTRSIAAEHPFDRTEEERDSEREDEEPSGPKYFAVLALDGDEMGKWVSGLHPNMPTLGEQMSCYPNPKHGRDTGARVYFEQHALTDLVDRKRPLNPSFHLQFSEMLANFGNFCVRRIVEAHDGRLIYSGGDDVLVALPAQEALPCARALRAAFQGEPVMLNGLEGAWRFRNGEWRKEPVRLFDCEQPGFIRLHKDAPSLEGEPKKFHAIVPGPAADCSIGIAIAHFKSPLQDVVREAQAAEKRAKSQLGRSAVAVTLVKRSGETIEWGCQWDSGGLAVHDAMVRAMGGGGVSGRFPHRVVQLLEGYLTQATPMAASSIEPVPAFSSVEVVTREFLYALDRQGKDKDSEAYVHLLRSAQGKNGGDASLIAYLENTRKRAEDRLREAREDQEGWSRLSPEARRSIEIDPVEAPIQALIGLCQTVAFSHRIGDHQTPPDPVSGVPAERQHQP